MAVKIRLKRMGKIRQPFYRVVVVDGRKKRDGRVIEEIGLYHPTEEPSRIEINSERAQYWLSVGAQPSEAVTAQLKITGDWQKFKGESGTEGTLKVADKSAEAAAARNAEAVKAAEAEAELKKAKASEEKAAAEATTEAEAAENTEPEDAESAEPEAAEADAGEQADGEQQES